MKEIKTEKYKKTAQRNAEFDRGENEKYLKYWQSNPDRFKAWISQFPPEKQKQIMDSIRVRKITN